MLYIVYGTRAELIKFSTLIRELKRRKVKFKTVDTGQHDNDSLHRSLRLPKPDIHLGKSYRDRWSGLQSSAVTYPIASAAALLWGLGVFAKLSRIISRGDTVVTHGNTMGVPMAILAAKVKNIGSRKKHRTVHMESGFRGNTKSSVFLDALYRFADRNSDVLFTPYKSTERNLRSEEVGGKIILSGDVMRDVVRETLRIRPTVKIPKGSYVVANSTRSISDRQKAKQLLQAFRDSPIDILFVANPSIKKRIEKMGLGGMLRSVRIKQLGPVDYPDFLHLLKRSKGAVTDSTGVEEECAILSKPCISTNDFLQIPELEAAGFVKTAGCNYIAVLGSLRKIAGGRWKTRRLPAIGKSPTKKIADELVRMEASR